MGIAGVALIFALFCVFRTIKAFVTYFSWHNKEIVDADAGEVINTEYAGKKSSKYTLSLVLHTNPETTTQYEEVAESYEKLSVKTGDRLEVYYDPGKEGKKQYQIVSQVKKELWQWPLFGVICVAVYIGCLFLASAILK